MEACSGSQVWYAIFPSLYQDNTHWSPDQLLSPMDTPPSMDSTMAARPTSSKQAMVSDHIFIQLFSVIEALWATQVNLRIRSN